MRLQVVLIVGAVLTLSSGCAHMPLKRNTQRQVRTVSDIQQQQVMDNIAMFVVNKNSVPFFSIPDAGSTQVIVSGSFTSGLTWNPTTLIGESLGIAGAGTLTENWALKPVNDPDRLAMMKCVYQQIVCKSGSDCFDCDLKLRTFFGDDYAYCEVPSSWVHIGAHRDVPTTACFSAKYCDTWVWVDAKHREQLSRVTFAILGIAIADTKEFDPDPPKQIEIEEELRFSNGRTVKATYTLPNSEFKRYREEADKIETHEPDTEEYSPAPANEPRTLNLSVPSLPRAPRKGLDLDRATSPRGSLSTPRRERDPLSGIRSQLQLPQ